VLTVPFSKGWKAYVGGKPAELLMANECYTGLKIVSGRHEIELVYHTPLMKAGALISLLGCVIFAGSMAWQRKKKN
jgi:uncharacterized membrane protein YfhO